MKHKLTLTIEREIIKLAKLKNINLSKFLEKKLCEELNIEITKKIIINEVKRK